MLAWNTAGSKCAQKPSPPDTVALVLLIRVPLLQGPPAEVESVRGRFHHEGGAYLSRCREVGCCGLGGSLTCQYLVEVTYQELVLSSLQIVDGTIERVKSPEEPSIKQTVICATC